MKIAAFILSLFVTCAYAEEIAVDFQHCYSGDLPLMQVNEKTIAFHWQHTGVIV